ncbi:MAG: hypothetical protein AAB696_01320 [Patescibacteria group bacterium]
MSKLNKILLAIVVILLVALGAIIYWQRGGFEKPYWAVYLNTGDLYFGKLNRFPKMSLSDVWLLQRNPQDTKNPLSLSKFKEVFWGPEDKLYLNDENIVWKAKLREDSQFVQSIKNPQNQSQTQNQPSVSSTSTLPNN